MDPESEDDLPLAQVFARRNSVEDSDSGSSDSLSDAPLTPNASPKKQPVLFEYEWPSNRSGNYFVIESELAKFLEKDDVPGRLILYCFDMFIFLLIYLYIYILEFM